ncbi:MAG: 3-oxoacyl-ACP reductase [Myxococcales bacterium]|nr:3-oxoacyl-ACP reductase [Myxococcales bacterium]
MHDFLLQLGASPSARKVLGALRLPLPLPQPLARGVGPYADLELRDEAVAVVSGPRPELASVVAHELARAGANPLLGSPELGPSFQGPGEAYGRPARPLESLGERAALAGIVLDATGLAAVRELRALYDGLAPLVGRVARGGRVVVLARPAAGDAGAFAARAAVEGFVRSLAKELGGRGVTANLLRVAEGADDRAAPVLRFLLSRRSSFVTAQPLVVSATARALREPPRTRPLEGKVALVTGAARGIGAATARALAREGAHVLCMDRPDEAPEVSQLARALGGTPVLADVTAPDAAERLAAAAAARGGLDVLVHNAGVTRDKTLARMKPEQWDMVLAVNLEAVVRLTRALDPLLRDDGRVLALSSVAGIAGNMGQTAYAATKAGVIGFVQAEATRLAARGVTANAVAPGFIETRMTAAVPLAIREGARRLSALGQGGLPEDVAEALTFLATPGSQGLTGQTLRVCGGALIGA